MHLGRLLYALLRCIDHCALPQTKMLQTLIAYARAVNRLEVLYRYPLAGRGMGGDTYRHHYALANNLEYIDMRWEDGDQMPDHGNVMLCYPRPVLERVGLAGVAWRHVPETVTRR